MKKVLLLAVLASGLAFGQTKKVTGSDVHWWGYKIVKTEASSHDGTVKVKSGNLVLKNGAVVGGDFVLDMTSINATDLSGEGKTKLEGHLKNGDFFEVELAEVSFESSEKSYSKVKYRSIRSNSAIPFQLTFLDLFVRTQCFTNLIEYAVNELVSIGCAKSLS